MEAAGTLGGAAVQVRSAVQLCTFKACASCPEAMMCPVAAGHFVIVTSACHQGIVTDEFF